MDNKGKSHKEIMSSLKSFKSCDMDWTTGKVFGYVYNASNEVIDLLKEASSEFLHENALDLKAFPSALTLENEVIKMTRSIVTKGMNSSEDSDRERINNVGGSFTTGGTESILMAIKSARDFCRDTKNIVKPNIVVPSTIHPAFMKACEYFCIECRISEVYSSYKANIDDMCNLIDENTIMLGASFPSYGTGTCDPIEAIGQVAIVHDLLFTVDACMGGMVAPFVDDEGVGMEDDYYYNNAYIKSKKLNEICSFNTLGITAITLDFHKFGYAAKGASAVMYRDSEIMKKYQAFVCSSWQGYSIVNSTIPSTKSSGPLAACYAVMKFLGVEGYKDRVRKSMIVADKIGNYIDHESDDLFIIGNPGLNLIAIGSETINVFLLSENMKSKGWFIQPQLGYKDMPASIHLTISAQNYPMVDEFIKDIKECVKLSKMPAKKINSKISNILTLAPKRMLEELLKLDDSSMSTVVSNTVLNVLPIEIRDQYLRGNLVSKLSIPDESWSGF